jgi:hypothetical protein
MAIQFFCPNCNEIHELENAQSGKRSQCTNCGQFFIVPPESFRKPKKVEPPKEKSDPIPGFYRAVFVDNFKLFLDKQNVTSLTFAVALVCFRFFTHGVCCFGYLTYFVAWGWLFGFYLNIIYETAFGIDKLPEIYLGTSVTFLWYILKPLFLFSFTMAVVQLPAIITILVLKEKGYSFDNIRQLEFGLLHVFFVLGLFLFPVATLTASVGQTITYFRPDYLLAPVLKTFAPYVVTVLLLIIAAFLETKTVQNTHASLPKTAFDLILNLTVQFVAILAMRSIGLFHRHYSCNFKW